MRQALCLCSLITVSKFSVNVSAAGVFFMNLCASFRQTRRPEAGRGARKTSSRMEKSVHVVLLSRKGSLRSTMVKVPGEVVKRPAFLLDVLLVLLTQEGSKNDSRRLRRMSIITFCPGCNPSLSRFTLNVE